MAQSFLKPALKDVLDIYLTMMGEIESEELVTALERIVAFYKEDMQPFALRLSTQLVDSYQKLILIDVKEDGGESANAAVECVTALSRIIRSCKNNAEVLAKLEQIIYPVLENCLSDQGLECMEEGVDCISLLVYYQGGLNGHVSKPLWKLLPSLLYSVTGHDMHSHP